MLCPVRGVREGFGATRELASVRLLSGVRPQMGLEVLQSRVGLAAVFELWKRKESENLVLKSINGSRFRRLGGLIGPHNLRNGRKQAFPIRTHTLLFSGSKYFDAFSPSPLPKRRILWRHVFLIPTWDSFFLCHFSPKKNLIFYARNRFSLSQEIEGSFSYHG